jgi:hypothetical protein
VAKFLNELKMKKQESWNLFSPDFVVTDPENLYAK